MPFGPATAVKNRNQTKIVMVPFDTSDGPGAQAYTYATIAGMSDAHRTPRMPTITRLTGGNVGAEFQITAMLTTGFTIAKLTGPGAASPATLLVKLQ